jgi:hypothetical protein
MDIVEEIKNPATDDNWALKILIGGILGLIPIVNFLVFCYLLKSARNAMENIDGMPEWDDLGNMFIQGLAGVIITLIYMIIPIIILFMSVGGVILSTLSGDVATIIAGVGAALGALLLALLLILVIGFVLPMALVMYVKEGSLGAAFRFKEVLSRIRSVFGDYLVVYLVLIILHFLLGFVASVPFAGWILYIFANFYIMVVIFRMYGKVYVKSSNDPFTKINI